MPTGTSSDRLGSAWATAGARRFVAAARFTTLGASALLALLFVYVLVGRLRYPNEVEWMTGAMCDHVTRVRQGKALYTAPTADWIPYIYPPVYYWLSAAAAGIVGSARVGCNLVSVLSTAVSAGAIGVVARRLGAKRFWAILATGLFLGAYGYTGTWYDIARCDSLMMALLLGGTALLLSRRSPLAAAVAGVLFGLACLTKQTALVFLPAAAIGLWIESGRRPTIPFSAAGAGLVAVVLGWLQWASAGWFGFYAFRVPSAHGMRASLLPTLANDLTRGLTLTAATAMLVGDTAHILLRGRLARPGAVLFACLLLAGFTAAAVARLHAGGWDNVLMAWTGFAIPGAVALASRLAANKGARAEVLLLAACTFQFAAWIYDPTARNSSWLRRFADQHMRGRIEALEQNGDVLVLGRGDVTAHMHFHVQILSDLVRAGFPVPEDVVSAFQQQRFAAVVADDFQELTMRWMLGRTSPFYRLVVANYFVAQRWDYPFPQTGWPGRPTWVLRPRRHPLDSRGDAALEARQRVEASIAEERMLVEQATHAAPDDGLDIEDLAEKLEASAPERFD